MKKLIFLVSMSFILIGVKAQQLERLSLATTLGTGIAMSAPTSTPFSWQILGYYNISNRFSVGLGSGLLLYEKALIPLFVDSKFMIVKPRKFTPYLECGVGYSFAPGKNNNGGLYLNPSLGIQYSICENMKLSLALGYEIQKLERLIELHQPFLTTEFSEKLSHNSISLRVGVIF